MHFFFCTVNKMMHMYCVYPHRVPVSHSCCWNDSTTVKNAVSSNNGINNNNSKAEQNNKLN